MLVHDQFHPFLAFIDMYNYVLHVILWNNVFMLHVLCLVGFKKYVTGNGYCCNTVQSCRGLYYRYHNTHIQSMELFDTAHPRTFYGYHVLKVALGFWSLLGRDWLTWCQLIRTRYLAVCYSMPAVVMTTWMSNCIECFCRNSYSWM